MGVRACLLILLAWLRQIYPLVNLEGTRCKFGDQSVFLLSCTYVSGDILSGGTACGIHSEAVLRGTRPTPTPPPMTDFAAVSREDFYAANPPCGLFPGCLGLPPRDELLTVHDMCHTLHYSVVRVLEKRTTISEIQRQDMHRLNALHLASRRYFCSYTVIPGVSSTRLHLDLVWGNFSLCSRRVHMNHLVGRY